MAFHRVTFRHELRSSIFLEPFAPPALPGFVATMAPLTPAERLSGVRQVSLLHVPNLPTIPSPITFRRSDCLACVPQSDLPPEPFRGTCSTHNAGQRWRQLGFAIGL